MNEQVIELLTEKRDELRSYADSLQDKLDEEIERLAEPITTFRDKRKEAYRFLESRSDRLFERADDTVQKGVGEIEGLLGEIEVDLFGKIDKLEDNVDEISDKISSEVDKVVNHDCLAKIERISDDMLGRLDSFVSIGENIVVKLDQSVGRLLDTVKPILDLIKEIEPILDAVQELSGAGS